MSAITSTLNGWITKDAPEEESISTIKDAGDTVLLGVKKRRKKHWWRQEGTNTEVQRNQRLYIYLRGRLRNVDLLKDFGSFGKATTRRK